MVWTLKGFQGSLNDEIAGPEDESFKKYRNYIITMIIFIIIATVIDKTNESKQRVKKENSYYMFK